MCPVFWDAEQYGGYLIVLRLRLEIGGGQPITWRRIKGHVIATNNYVL